MNREVLVRPFPPELIKQRQGQGGRTLSYVEAWAFVQRLNEGCDSWSFEIIRHEIMADEVVVVAKLIADGVVKMSFGGSSVTKDNSGREVSIADDLKAAASDALKKAASLLGVGLELYGGNATSNSSSNTAAPEKARSTLTAPRPSFDDRLSSRQLSAIHAVARRKGIPPLELATMVRDRWQKEGPQHLSRREASDLISELSGTNGS